MKDRHNELLTLADHIVDFGAEKVDQIEVFVQDNFEIGVEINLGQMNKAAKSQDVGASIRCVLKNRIGSAFTNSLDRTTLEEAVKRAISAAKASTPDKTWSDFPQKTSYPKPKDTWDDSIPERDPGEFVELTTNIAKQISDRDKTIIIGDAGVGGFFGWTAYANSNGVSIADRGTGAYAYSVLVAPTPNGMTPSVFAVDVKRNFNLDIDYVVNSSVDDVLLAKKPAKGETGSGTIVFAAGALGGLLLFSFVPALRGENVVREKSRLAERKGDTIASKTLSITDDGLYPGGYSTALFDGEGVPRQTTSIIDKGKLRSFLWNTYWGQRHGETSTGNASREVRTGVVNIQPTNLVVPTGKPSFEDLIGEVKSGYLIKGLQGAHSSNQETGDYSVVGNPAYRIEDGELTGCVHGLMLAGNSFELIKKVDQLGSDIRSYLIWGVGSIIGPSIRFTDIQIVAKAD